jgi:hypothetical protein
MIESNSSYGRFDLDSVTIDYIPFGGECVNEQPNGLICVRLNGVRIEIDRQPLSRQLFCHLCIHTQAKKCIHWHDLKSYGFLRFCMRCKKPLDGK